MRIMANIRPIIRIEKKAKYETNENKLIIYSIWNLRNGYYYSFIKIYVRILKIFYKIETIIYKSELRSSRITWSFVTA